ncbi:MAG: ABC transporter ATP-binding protein [Candidatus Omnitrophica bacterium]|nr:ABC transporter ATP-binding protein [Candidatus Omnitrophota bacterium]
MNKSTILEARNVTKFYSDGQVKALDGISLQVFAGEILMLRGPSGCGKSTLMHLLGGLDIPTSGEVLFNGVSIQDMCRVKGFRVKNMGFVFQSFYLWQNLNVLENVMLPLVELPMNRQDRLARVSEIVEIVGVADKLKASVKKLSVGQRQRVAVARALVARPTVVLADEPTGSLDSKNTDNILQLFRRINRESGVTIAMVTHENISAEYYDRQVEILDGRICT